MAESEGKKKFQGSVEGGLAVAHGFSVKTVGPFFWIWDWQGRSRVIRTQ